MGDVSVITCTRSHLISSHDPPTLYPIYRVACIYELNSLPVIQLNVLYIHSIDGAEKGFDHHFSYDCTWNRNCSKV